MLTEYINQLLHSVCIRHACAQCGRTLMRAVETAAATVTKACGSRLLAEKIAVIEAGGCGGSTSCFVQQPRFGPRDHVVR